MLCGASRPFCRVFRFFADKMRGGTYAEQDFSAISQERKRFSAAARRDAPKREERATPSLQKLFDLFGNTVVHFKFAVFENPVDGRFVHGVDKFGNVHFARKTGRSELFEEVEI